MLADALESIQARIAEWEGEYDVESPSGLLASIVDVDTSAEVEKRREIASKWGYLADRLPVVKTPLKEYDWVTDRDVVPV